ncbi:Bestrophin, RFP-TM, chloride channel-domain-containing protein [Favolaschia claudopus]|uniref:Bestrophin, RFP-TM, chloride channel-domain-containing protein n=1 Tax=Favolaschia claudopus TaxID=2862362 RepID=A0AAW0BT94_9AGAR
MTPHHSIGRSAHNLLPAVKPAAAVKIVPEIPTFTFVAWTFGRGSVIWSIWPAVLLHTLFAVGVVFFWEYQGRDIDIPNVMLTVLGVVIGFVISYRAMSGYDRYWMGRAAWSDVMKNSRTIGRLIWYHVPPRLTPKTAEETTSGQVIRTQQELNKVMAEKRMALDLVLAFAVAVKHHIRGELGIYYDDLYHLVRPLHDHTHTAKQQQRHNAESAAAISPRPTARVTSSSHLPMATPPPPPTSSGPPKGPALVPAHNVYGTFDPSRTGSRTSLKHNLRRGSSRDSTDSHHEPLLPGSNPTGEVHSDIQQDLIPFAGVFSSIRLWFYRRFGKKNSQPIIPQYNGGPPPRKWAGPIHPDLKLLKVKRETGENLPEEILRCLSEWCSVLEDRNTVPGGNVGGIMGCLTAFEASLATLEHILTTPLPFVFSVHISTVWLYLFLLPFQLINQFGWHTVPAVTIGSFIYLGFVAAGEEIEQPFGYDENDLDLDLFCQDIIKQDMESLKSSPCLNAYLGPDEPILVRQRSMNLAEASAHDEFEDVSDVEE